MNKIHSFDLFHEITTALDARVQSVLADLKENDTTRACSYLTDLIDQTKGIELASDQANVIINATSQVQEELGCRP